MTLNTDILKELEGYKSPFLLSDLNILRDNYTKIKSSVKNVEVCYAMKANDNATIVKTLSNMGSSFEISSLSELNFLKSIGVESSKIICLNTIKSPEFLEQMLKENVEVIAFDSTYEVDKILTYAPNSKLVLRLVVSNEGSDWPLTKKFGVTEEEATTLLKYAKSKGVKVIGLTFHVGSQCLNKDAWSNALDICSRVWQFALQEKMDFNYLSLGGGLPVKHLKEIPELSEIGQEIERSIGSRFTTKSNNLRVTIEPGRGLVGNTAIMVSTVVGMAKREKQNWIYLDVGVFNGLMETIEKFEYKIETDNKRKKVLYTVSGPSCDSVDIMFENIMLPEVKVGERLYILNTGAYTTVYASDFNGFGIPKMYFIN